MSRRQRPRNQLRTECIDQTPSQAQQQIYKDKDDLITQAGTRGQSKPNDKRQEQQEREVPGDVLDAVMGGIGLIGAIGTLAAAAIFALDGEQE